MRRDIAVFLTGLLLALILAASISVWSTPL